MGEAIDGVVDVGEVSVFASVVREVPDGDGLDALAEGRRVGHGGSLVLLIFILS